MFDNVGNKIKSVARIIAWTGIIFFCILGIVVCFTNRFPYSGIIIMIVGSLISWLSSLSLYGFGQLIENSDKLVALQSGDGVYSEEAKKTDKNNLDVLKKWKENGLISDEEYQSKIEG